MGKKLAVFFAKKADAQKRIEVEIVPVVKEENITKSESVKKSHVEVLDHAAQALAAMKDRELNEADYLEIAEIVEELEQLYGPTEETETEE